MNKLSTYALITITASGLLMGTTTFAKENNHGKVVSEAAHARIEVIKEIKNEHKETVKTLRNTFKDDFKEIKKTFKNQEWHPVTSTTGTPANVVAFRTAVKNAKTTYMAALQAARNAFTVAILTAKNTFLIGKANTTSTAPIVSVTAAANPSTVSGTTTTLSVLGNDDKGESNLVYYWSVVSKPSGANYPTFSKNGSHDASTTVASFSTAGSYTLRATISDGHLVTTSDVTVTVKQVLTNVSVSPASVAVHANSSTQFAASSSDQFGNFLATNYFWSIFEGPIGGTISNTGYYTATSTPGTYHVVVSSTTPDYTKQATSTVTVTTTP